MDDYSTWKLVGHIFRCGCCGKIPVYVDIRDLKTCPHCEHVMKWYETDHGIFSMPAREEEDGGVV